MIWITILMTMTMRVFVNAAGGFRCRQLGTETPWHPRNPTDVRPLYLSTMYTFTYTFSGKPFDDKMQQYLQFLQHLWILGLDLSFPLTLPRVKLVIIASIFLLTFLYLINILPPFRIKSERKLKQKLRKQSGWSELPHCNFSNWIYVTTLSHRTVSGPLFQLL